VNRVTNDVIMPNRMPIIRPPRLTVKKAATASNIYTVNKHSRSCLRYQMQQMSFTTLKLSIKFTAFKKSH